MIAIINFMRTAYHIACKAPPFRAGDIRRRCPVVPLFPYNRRLAREAADVGWAQFLTFLQRKAAAAGRKVVAVNPANTSQLCSGCGQIVPKKLSDRWHLCPHCGTSLDRDHNAAIKILRLAG
jgi:transposase